MRTLLKLALTAIITTSARNALATKIKLKSLLLLSDTHSHSRAPT